jgi:uncharacterized protein
MNPELRLLSPADTPALRSFLDAHAAPALFLRSNLAQSGIVDGNTPYHGRYAGAIRGGQVIGVAAHYWNGILILQASSHASELTRLATKGRSVTGICGPLTNIQAAKLVFPARAPVVDSTEDLFQLKLNKLRTPAPLVNGQLKCRRAEPKDIPLLSRWRLEFDIVLNGADESSAARRHAREAVTQWVSEGVQFVLWRDDQPVAGCCFGAKLADMVMVNNVWTPPDLRGCGYARAVVAGALRHAAAEGVQHAVIFTGVDNDAARQAYLGLGFTRIGDYGIVHYPR